MPARRAGHEIPFGQIRNSQRNALLSIDVSSTPQCPSQSGSLASRSACRSGFYCIKSCMHANVQYLRFKLENITICVLSTKQPREKVFSTFVIQPSCKVIRAGRDQKLSHGIEKACDGNAYAHLLDFTIPSDHLNASQSVSLYFSHAIYDCMIYDTYLIHFEVSKANGEI